MKVRLVVTCAVMLSACASTPAPTAEPVELCTEMAARCGGDHTDSWQAWCESGCVPMHARMYRCAENAACVLCDAPRDDGQITYFALPSEIEFLWDGTTGTEAADPAPVAAPTGSAFDDAPGGWGATSSGVGAWQAYQPYVVAPGDPMGFCEPGPNQFLAANAMGSGSELVLEAERTSDALYCEYPGCPGGPYEACGAAPASQCQYHDMPETMGAGTAAQLDRALPSGELATYGYGRFRSIHGTGTDSVPASPGFNYAFYLQSNAYCVDGVANTTGNTDEIDIEISSGTGAIEDAGPYCDERDMCFQLVNWVSSGQGLAVHGTERRATSGFRFQSPDVARQLHTWGWDWSEGDIRFTYDSDPTDCDEHAGSCLPEQASLAICEHTRFVPQRPGAMHLQLWNARWAGDAPGGTRANMRFQRIWHEPGSH